MYQQEENKKYLNIKEASVQYNVSRGKLHSLINLGHLHTEPDPRDGRARLLSSQELEELFGLTGGDPLTEGDTTEGDSLTGGGTTGGDSLTGGDTTEGDTMYKSPYTAYTTGRLTSLARGRLDALRRRVTVTGKRATDSVEIIREMRAERSGSPYV